MKHLTRAGGSLATTIGLAVALAAPAHASTVDSSATEHPLGFLAWWAVVSIVVGSAVIAVAMHRAFRAR